MSWVKKSIDLSYEDSSFLTQECSDFRWITTENIRTYIKLKSNRLLNISEKPITMNTFWHLYLLSHSFCSITLRYSPITDILENRALRIQHELLTAGYYIFSTSHSLPMTPDSDISGMPKPCKARLTLWGVLLCLPLYGFCACNMDYACLL